MAIINRCPGRAASETYDSIIVGGGVYGVMLLLEASRRGLRALLLEKDDFGAGTSFNSLRIIHGGFRYLQQLDLLRFRESVRERQWFLRTFPDLVRPLPCLMPLYGRGLKRRPVLRAAIRINDLLSWKRNRSLRADRVIPPGKLLTSKQTQEIFPGVNPAGLRGSAVWYDACVPDSQRLVVEALRWACGLGGTALNYVEVCELKKRGQEVTGVLAVDRENGGQYELRATTVINAAGPQSRLLAQRFDRDISALFKPTLAWNVLFDREAPSDHALAVTSTRRHEQTYFIHPWKGALLIGTGHASWKGLPNEPKVPLDLLRDFIDDVNSAIPDLDLTVRDVVRIYAGFVPAAKTGEPRPSNREVIVDHAQHGGPHGLYSVSGVKFTSSQAVAEKVLAFIFPNRAIGTQAGSMEVDSEPHSLSKHGLFDRSWKPQPVDVKWKEDMAILIEEESVIHLDDLLFRRTNLGDDPRRAVAVAPELCALFSWDRHRRTSELAALKELVNIDNQIQG